MGIRPYLAMTEGEMEKFGDQTARKALMAGLFSPYSNGLAELPRVLLRNCPLVLSDRIPIQGHSGQRILEDLKGLSPCALILDFQRTENQEAAELAAYLHQELPCPVIISAPYASNLPCPVLLPPAPCHVPLSMHLKGWAGREIWLELAPVPEILTVTDQGASLWEEEFDAPLLHRDPKLCCHYSIEVFSDRAVFRLMRTGEDLMSLQEKAEAMGITTIGLFQEIGSHWI